MKLTSLLVLACLCALVLEVSAANPRFASKKRKAIFVPTVASPDAAFQDTGVSFVIRGFIPGPGCAPSAMATGDYVKLTNKCANMEATKDGIVDDNIWPTPGIPDSWFRTDNRCFDNKKDASYRIAAFCSLFKKGAEAKFIVKCQAKAGWTRHYSKKIFALNHCFEMSCQKQDSLDSVITTPEFAADKDQPIDLSIKGNDPCLPLGDTFVSKLMPHAKVMLSKSHVKVTGKTLSITLQGDVSHFPAMEGYAYATPGDAAPVELFKHTPSSPIKIILPDENFPAVTKTVNCASC